MPEVITSLGRMERGAGGEVQLTDGMAKLIGRQPFHGLRYEGQRFDCGDKIGFLEAQIAYALKRPEMADAVRAFLGAIQIGRISLSPPYRERLSDGVLTSLRSDNAA